jgi:hypothetical protein
MGFWSKIFRPKKVVEAAGTMTGLAILAALLHNLNVINIEIKKAPENIKQQQTAQDSSYVGQDTSRVAETNKYVIETCDIALKLNDDITAQSRIACGLLDPKTTVTESQLMFQRKCLVQLEERIVQLVQRIQQAKKLNGSEIFPDKVITWYQEDMNYLENLKEDLSSRIADIKLNLKPA